MPEAPAQLEDRSDASPSFQPPVADTEATTAATGATPVRSADGQAGGGVSQLLTSASAGRKVRLSGASKDAGTERSFAELRYVLGSVA